MSAIKSYSFLFTAMALLTLTCTAFSQSGFYVPKKGKIFFKGDTATVFSNVVNEGKLGIGKKAVVNFAGEKWTNTADAEIAADTTAGVAEGGWIRFIGTARQKLDAGYNAALKNGPVFQNLQVDNAYGIELTGSSASVSREIAFKLGLFYLNDYMLTLGNNNSGTVSGYDSSKYFVTNYNSGLLIREGITSNDGWVSFPVGSKEQHYTPAALRSLSELPDDFYVSVFDSVRSGATTGSLLMNESVGKTWQIGKRFLTNDNHVEIALQHLNDGEGSFFAANKTKAYVSHFNNGRWDVGYPQTHPGIGHLTTSAPLLNSGTNSRPFFSTLTDASYFTKFTGAGDTSRTRLWFNAYRVDRAIVNVYWSTQPEINVDYFVVQRRLATEAGFKNIDTVRSLAQNGYSRQLLNYAINDPNAFTGISFYRLMSVEYNRDSAYSQIVAVGNKAGEFNSELWPNPTSGNFYISLNTPQPVKKIIIWNVLGQKVMEQETGGLRVVQVNANKLAAANYYVSLVGMFDTIIETKKLIIVR